MVASAGRRADPGIAALGIRETADLVASGSAKVEAEPTNTMLSSDSTHRPSTEAPVAETRHTGCGVAEIIIEDGRAAGAGPDPSNAHRNPSTTPTMGFNP